MTFARLNAQATDLRASLRAFVGESAFPEITIRPPENSGDEASFMRLISWCYALLFEAGRLTVPYLLKLSGQQNTLSNETLDLVHALRTWSSHNLGFSSERDVAMHRRVQRWFIQTCQKNPPNDHATWERCSLALCADVIEVLGACQKAVTNVLSSEDDGQSAIADLQRRLERAWPAHFFDEIVGDAAVRVGVQVDAQKFRTPRMSRWRALLDALPQEANLQREIARIIEQELMEHAAQSLPIDGRDIMERLNIPPGREVAGMLQRAKELFRDGVRDPEDILRELGEEHLNRG